MTIGNSFLPLHLVNDESAKVKGSWDSIHVVEVSERASTKTASYKLTSTIMLTLVHGKPTLGKMQLGGSLTRQVHSHSQPTFLVALIHDLAANPDPF